MREEPALAVLFESPGRHWRAILALRVPIHVQACRFTDVGQCPTYALAVAVAFARSKSAGHDGPLLYRGPSEAAVGRRKVRRVADMARAWMPELRQRMERLPNVSQFFVRAGCPVEKPRSPAAYPMDRRRHGCRS